jgi:Holliday junction resolvase
MKEQQVQSKIIKRLEEQGWYVIKLIKTNKNGIPDLVAFKDNDFQFIEVKAETGKLSELQKFRIEELKSKGFKVYELRN